MSWNVLLALIAPHYPKPSRLGRQPYPLATMLRIWNHKRVYRIRTMRYAWQARALFDTVEQVQEGRALTMDVQPRAPQYGAWQHHPNAGS